MLAQDDRHWWYRGRRRVLRAILDDLPLPARALLLDAGCGSGRTLDELCHYGAASGADISLDAVAHARRRGHNVHHARVEELPFRAQTFDVVTCLDVVEHTPDDRETLVELHRVLRPGGFLILTVPAHPLLWSRHDELNLHYRRYTRRALRRLAGDVQLELVRETYFNGVLLPAAALVRWGQRIGVGPSAVSDLQLTPAPLNRLLELPLAAEARLLAAGGRVPAGLSLLCVLRAPASIPVSPVAWAPSAPPARRRAAVPA